MSLETYFTTFFIYYFLKPGHHSQFVIQIFSFLFYAVSACEIKCAMLHQYSMYAAGYQTNYNFGLPVKLHKLKTQ